MDAFIPNSKFSCKKYIFGFIRYKNIDEANRAIISCNGKLLNGSRLSVILSHQNNTTPHLQAPPSNFSFSPIFTNQPNQQFFSNNYHVPIQNSSRTPNLNPPPSKTNIISYKEALQIKPAPQSTNIILPNFNSHSPNSPRTLSKYLDPILCGLSLFQSSAQVNTHRAPDSHLFPEILLFNILQAPCPPAADLKSASNPSIDSFCSSDSPCISMLNQLHDSGDDIGKKIHISYSALCSESSPAISPPSESAAPSVTTEKTTRISSLTVSVLPCSGEGIFQISNSFVKASIVANMPGMVGSDSTTPTDFAVSAHDSTTASCSRSTLSVLCSKPILAYAPIKPSRSENFVDHWAAPSSFEPLPLGSSHEIRTKKKARKTLNFHKLFVIPPRWAKLYTHSLKAQRISRIMQTQSSESYSYFLIETCSPHFQSPCIFTSKPVFATSSTPDYN